MSESSPPRVVAEPPPMRERMRDRDANIYYDPHKVVVTDIHMSFRSMVVFIIKWTLASIPALLILFVLSLAFWACFGFTMGLLGR